MILIANVVVLQNVAGQYANLFKKENKLMNIKPLDLIHISLKKKVF